MRVLIVTPNFPYPSTGACEQDRARGIEWFVEHGHKVYVIAKINSKHPPELIKEVEKRLGIEIVGVPYKYNGVLKFKEKVKKIALRILQPWYLDGAAFEYSDKEIQHAVRDTLVSFKPDVVWFDYTYLWPLYFMVRRAHIPIITRSINFEPLHFLDEDGWTIINILKAIPKFLSELITIWLSDVVFAITPHEEKMYKKLGAMVSLLPLRGLPYFFSFTYHAHTRSPLNVFFFGSTYNVAHNRRALGMVLREIAPRVQKRMPRKFQFHICGAKVPSEFDTYFGNDVVRHGYVPSDQFEKFISNMDIALIPSLFGAGMQQKIFEPLARGIPTITSARGLGGFNFQDKKEIMLAQTVDDFVGGLNYLLEVSRRDEIGNSARQQSFLLFSQKEIDHSLHNCFAYLHLSI